MELKFEFFFLPEHIRLYDIYLTNKCLISNDNRISFTHLSNKVSSFEIKKKKIIHLIIFLFSNSVISLEDELDYNRELFITVYVSPDGSDIFGNGSLELPYATVNYALYVTAGDNIEIILLPGKYILKSDIFFNDRERIHLTSYNKTDKAELIDFGVRSMFYFTN